MCFDNSGFETNRAKQKALESVQLTVHRDEAGKYPEEAKYNNTISREWLERLKEVFGEDHVGEGDTEDEANADLSRKLERES